MAAEASQRHRARLLWAWYLSLSATKISLFRLRELHRQSLADAKRQAFASKDWNHNSLGNKRGGIPQFPAVFL
jgi:hypothetical protein